MVRGRHRRRGPDVYQLAQAYRIEHAAVAVERLLKARVANIERSRVGSSHAVFMVTLDDRREFVARFATHSEHRLAREVWASERCRRAGLPVPRLVVTDFTASELSPPLAVYERMRGEPAHLGVMSPLERIRIFEQLGGIASRMHQLCVPGLGQIEPRRDGWAATERSWTEYNRAAIERQISRLPPDTVPLSMIVELRRRVAATRTALDAAVPPEAPASSLVHGDFRLENMLVMRDAQRGFHISAVLDFEMVLAGDGAVDIAWLYYQDGQRASELSALLRGYGVTILHPELEQRLLLYQLKYALEHMWWKVEFCDRSGMEQVRRRIRTLLDGSLSSS